jgi:hypothetical protein
MFASAVWLPLALLPHCHGDSGASGSPPDKLLITCSLGITYQIEQDDRRCRRVFISRRCIAQRLSLLSASGAIDLGELSDIPRDEEI